MCNRGGILLGAKRGSPPAGRSLRFKIRNLKVQYAM